MKLSTLSTYLHGNLSIAELVPMLELARYEQALSKRGASVHVQVEEDTDLAIERFEVIFLCSEFIAGRLTRVQLAYIADGLQLSERVAFSEEWVADAVAEFTDPEINGAFTVERANEIVDG